MWIKARRRPVCSFARYENILSREIKLIMRWQGKTLHIRILHMYIRIGGLFCGRRRRNRGAIRRSRATEIRSRSDANPRYLSLCGEDDEVYSVCPSHLFVYLKSELDACLDRDLKYKWLHRARIERLPRYAHATYFCRKNAGFSVGRDERSSDKPSLSAVVV